MGREHEDLVLVTGRLASGVTFSCNVDWISPTKIRRTRVLGERGMFEADTLTADLTLFRNGERATAPWLQQQRGVTEGDMTRFAIAKPEPLGAELRGGARDGPAARSGRRDARGGPRDRARRRGRAGERPQRRDRQALMRAVVVALGKIGLPLAVQIANAGHDVVGCDIDERVVELVRAGKAPFPNEPGIEEALPIEALPPTPPRPSPSADLVVLVPPLLVDAAGATDWRAFDGAVADVARGRAGRARPS